MQTRTAGITLVALSAVGWSTAGLLVRLTALDVWAIAGWRGIFGAALVALYLVVREGTEAPTILARLSWPGWLVATLTTLSSVSYLGALQVGSIADVVVIHATSPFATASIAWLVLRELPSRSTMLAGSFALVGILVVVGRWDGGSSAFGMLLACFATATMGFVTVLSRKFRKVSMIPATCLSAVQLGIAGSVCAPLGSVSGRDLAVLAMLAFTLSASLACYVEGARRIVASEAALLGALDVPLAPLWVWLVLGEVPATATLAGGSMVMAAALYDISGSRRGRSRCAPGAPGR